MGLALTDDDLKEATAHIKALADEKPMALEDVDAVLRAWQRPEISKTPNASSNGAMLKAQVLDPLGVAA